MLESQYAGSHPTNTSSLCWPANTAFSLLSVWPRWQPSQQVVMMRPHHHHHHPPHTSLVTQTGPDNFSFSTRLRWKSPPFSLDLPSSVGEGLGWSGWLSYLDQYHQLPIPSAGPATGCEEKISGDFALLVRSAVRYQASSHS